MMLTVTTFICRINDDKLFAPKYFQIKFVNNQTF
jgi:hypothetical protein